MSSRLRTRLRAGTGLSTPSLNLEFQTAAGTLDPRITFSRTSQATLVDSTGKLTYAPNNLLTNSQDFEAAAWIVNGTPTITANTTVAPDGSTTADTIAVSGASNGFGVYRNTTLVGNFIASVYFKLLNGAFTLRLGLTGNYSEINCSTLSITNVGTSVGSVSSVGNGWYRFASVGSLSAASAFFIYNIGSNTGSIAVWGAQLEQVTYQTTPGTYNSTSPKNLLGYTQEFDNAAWTKSNAFVQTNLLSYSQEFDNAYWSKLNATTTANTTAAPDGTATAETLTSTSSVSNTTGVFRNTGVLAAGHTMTVYAKAGTSSIAWLSGDNAQSYGVFNLSNGTVISSANATASITSVGGGWYRLVVANTTVSNNFFIVGGKDAYTSGHPWANGTWTSGNTILIWGAQLVQGSTAGDYQRTDAAAAAVQYVAPDGSLTADKLVETTAASTVHQVSQIYSGAVASGVYTFNVYLAKNERDKAVVIVSDNATGDCRVIVDLTAGTVGSPTITGNWTTASATIQAASGGFFRVSITCTKSASGNANVVPVVGLYTTSASYTGDGTSGVYIWGAQLSNSASLDPYVYNPVAAPTSAAYYGPRFDYDPVTLANKGLLIEEQRTNLLTYSQQFDDASWVKYAGTSITPNATISPDGSSTADLMYPATSGTNRGVYQTFTGGNLTYAQSIYVKSAGKNFVAFYDFEGSTYAGSVDLTTGSTASVKAGYTITPTQAGSGWWRITVTATTTTGTRYLTLIVVDAAGSASVTANGTSGVYIWGAQVEAGSFATSYIPTVASQVTRTADVALMQGANFSNWYNQNEGTFTAEATVATADNLGNRFVAQADAGTDATRLLLALDFSAQAVADVSTVRQALLDGGTPSIGSFNRLAFAYRVNDFGLSLNGGAVATDTSGAVPTTSVLRIGNGASGTVSILNGHIRRIGYYPTRLANAQLQSLTAQSTIPSLSLDFTTQVFNVG